MVSKIQFCQASDPQYGFLSNMYPASMMFDGILWLSAEHCYQAQKFKHNREIFQEIKEASSGDEARRLAKKYKDERNPNWNGIKEELLFIIMKEKFTNSPDMREKLRQTGSVYLEKSVPDDPFWGVLPDGTGQNMMGKMLMDIRQELQPNMAGV